MYVEFVNYKFLIFFKGEGYNDKKNTICIFVVYKYNIL